MKQRTNFDTVRAQLAESLPPALAEALPAQALDALLLLWLTDPERARAQEQALVAAAERILEASE